MTRDDEHALQLARAGIANLQTGVKQGGKTEPAYSDQAHPHPAEDLYRFIPADAKRPYACARKSSPAECDDSSS